MKAETQHGGEGQQSIARLEVLRGHVLGGVMSIEPVLLNVVDDRVRCEESDALLRLDEFAHRGGRNGVGDPLRNDVDVGSILRQHGARRNQRRQIQTHALDHGHTDRAENQLQLQK